MIEAPGRMTVRDVPSLPLPPNEVRVAVRAVGVCAGDVYIYKGVNPYASFPVVGGHEIAGVVSEVGAQVAGLQPGMRVVVEPFVGCGHCYPCRVGKPNCCVNLSIIGVHRPGGFAEEVSAPASHVHPVPPGLSFEWASFAEPVAIGVQACRRGEVGTELVLVLGCGPIGLALIEVARSRGARVLAADLLPERLALAQTLGAETLSAGPGLREALLGRTKGEGAPVVIEATGSPPVMAEAAELVAAGGRVVIVGLAKRGQTLELPALDLTRKEMTILGSRASSGCFPEALALLASGQVRYPQVMTTFSMWEAPEVLARLERDPAALHKAVLTLPGAGGAARQENP